jgi:hypothetical protein
MITSFTRNNTVIVEHDGVGIFEQPMSSKGDAQELAAMLNANLSMKPWEVFVEWLLYHFPNKAELKRGKRFVQ